MLSAQDVGLRQGDGVAGIEVMVMGTAEWQRRSNQSSYSRNPCERLKVFRG